MNPLAYNRLHPYIFVDVDLIYTRDNQIDMHNLCVIDSLYGGMGFASRRANHSVIFEDGFGMLMYRRVHTNSGLRAFTALEWSGDCDLLPIDPEWGAKEAWTRIQETEPPQFAILEQGWRPWWHHQSTCVIELAKR